MKKTVKQVIGIDVAQKELVVCVGRMHDDWSPELYAHKSFPNNEKGFTNLLLWVHKLTDKSVSLHFVMEATGVYHEAFVYHLDEKGHTLSIVLPNKISNYMRTLDTRTVTDKTASEAITLFGLERKLDHWQKPKDIFRQLRQLSREREQVIFERTAAKTSCTAKCGVSFLISLFFDGLSFFYQRRNRELRPSIYRSPHISGAHVCGKYL